MSTLTTTAGATPSRRAAALAYVQVAAAASSWGCWSLVLRPVGLSPWATVPVVFALMGLVLLPLARFDGVTPRWDRTTLALLVASTLLDAGNAVAFFGAMGVTTVAIAVLTHYLAPLLVALAAPLVERQRVPGSIACAGVAVVGLALVLQPWTHGAAGRPWLGAALGATSAVGYAANVFVARRLAARIGSARAVSWHGFLGAALFLPLVDGRSLASAGASHLALLVAGGVLFGALAGWLFVRGLRVIGSTKASMLAFLEPLVAVTVGWLVWGERLGALAVAGALLVVGAGAWVTCVRPTTPAATERAAGAAAIDEA